MAPNQLKERIEMVRAMETIARSINNEEILESWLMCGVADSDITSETTDGELYDYVEDDVFKDLMDCFMKCMKNAYRDGGLYCGGITGGTRK